MRLWILSAVMVLVSCGTKQAPKAEPTDYMERPESYRISSMDAALIERAFGERLPLEFRSPMALRDIVTNERAVASDLKTLKGAAMRGDQALERMVNFAAFILKRKGYQAEADQIVGEYYSRYVGFLTSREVNRDLGDHSPLLVWLDTWYKKLEAILGPTIMRTTNLEHLKIMNYSIPVVFNPSGLNGDFWDMDEYRNHFAGTRMTFFYPANQHNGFAGVVAYWAVWGACTAATYGIGGILPFICGPVGEVSCYGVGKYIAPPVSDWVYCKYSVCQ